MEEGSPTIMWQKIIGHIKQIDQLKKATCSEKLHHAYLLTGIDGIGKRLVASACAKTILCQQPSKTGDPCDKCDSCIKWKANSHPDYVNVEPDGSLIKIDQIRNIKDQLKFPPMVGNHRVIIIDHAEKMNPNAANAALKILEEPPAGNHFFLVTPTPNQLLPTIISRCQTIAFSPLTPSEIEGYLTTDGNLTSEEAILAATMSEGSIGRALSITPELINQVIQDFSTAIRARSASALMELASNWASEKEEIDNILYVLHRTFHNALLLNSGNSIPSGTNEALELAQWIAEQNNLGRLREKCTQINASHAQAARTYNKQLMFEQLLFTLAS